MDFKILLGDVSGGDPQRNSAQKFFLQDLLHLYCTFSFNCPGTMNGKFMYYSLIGLQRQRMDQTGSTQGEIDDWNANVWSFIYFS